MLAGSGGYPGAGGVCLFEERGCLCCVWLEITLGCVTRRRGVTRDGKLGVSGGPWRLYMHTEFEVFIFSHFGDIKGFQNLKNGSRDQAPTLFDLICIFLVRASMSSQKSEV